MTMPTAMMISLGNSSFSRNDWQEILPADKTAAKVCIPTTLSIDPSWELVIIPT
jgi:hypothetical protein